MELVKVAYLDAGGYAQRDAAAVARNIARESGSEVTWTGFNEGATHGSIGRRLLRLRHASTLTAERVCQIGAYVVAPAVTDTSSGYIKRELLAAILARFWPTTILLVRRQPLRDNQVLLLIDSTHACRELARRFVQLGLWGEVRTAILPRDRPPVALFLRDHVEMLRSCGGRPVTVLPASTSTRAAVHPRPR